MSNLREWAKERYETIIDFEKSVDTIKKEEMVERTCAALKKVFEYDAYPWSIDHENGYVIVDGIVFTCHWSYHLHALQIVTPCADCGTPILSNFIYDTVDLAREIAHPEPQYHTCQKKTAQAEKTAGEKLAEALCEYLSENGYINE